MHGQCLIAQVSYETMQQQQTSVYLDCLKAENYFKRQLLSLFCPNYFNILAPEEYLTQPLPSLHFKFII